MPIAETINDKYIKERVLNFALNKMGLAYSKLEQYKQSLQFFQQALSKKELYLFEKYDILNNIGSVYLKIGDYSRAKEYYQEALKFSQNLTGDPGANGFILNNIGSAHTKMGEYTQALSTYRQALALFQELKDFPGERATLSNMS
ncbi:MAG: tetratricopeptide repeat protein [Symploca sp. SIO2G7]|nr:tetratricopeptide repeat protein [Symploca sp. SIO2G7]